MAFTSVATMTLALGAHATVIGFDDLNTRNSFNRLGILDTYAGYEWGYGISGGVDSRTFVNADKGWAVASTERTAYRNSMPVGIDGSSYAWNWGGTQSLWIDFKGRADVTSVDLAAIANCDFSGKANTLQLFGYGANNELLASSDVLTLSEQFQTLTTAFNGVSYLEIRADRARSWFSLDRLVLNENSIVVPEPGALALMVMGLVGMVMSRRRCVS